MLSQKVDECKPCRHPRRPLLPEQEYFLPSSPWCSGESSDESKV
jgi:hypothetical protein